MPSAFSGNRSPGRRRLLLLLLLCLSLSGGSTADLTLTTQDTSQSQANSLTQMNAGFNESSPALLGPGLTMQLEGHTMKDMSLTSVRKYEILLDASVINLTKTFATMTRFHLQNYFDHKQPQQGYSHSSVERPVVLDSAITIEISCRLSNKYSYLKNPQVSWKKGSETIENVNNVGNSWSIRLEIVDSSKLGSYSCNLIDEEISFVVHLQLPKIDGKKKPIITYVGDTAVLICKTHDYAPLSWTWYMTNGSKQVAINNSLADKYVIDTISTNKTRLKIMKVTEEDDGVYWCEAAFKLGKSKRKQQLTVLTFLVPLKPFLGIVAEVVVLLTVVFLYELYSKRKANTEEEKESDQVEQLKTEEKSDLEKKEC